MFLAWVLIAAGTFAAQVPVPALNSRVTDLTGTLTPVQSRQLEAQLQQFEAAKGSQVVVLIVPSSKPETIEQFSIRVADQWKIGRKGVDDGVILLVAKNDRTLRIEVGRGLEGAIPDVTAHRIIDEIIVPYFRKGDFSGGIEAGVGRILKVIQGEPLPAPKVNRSPYKSLVEPIFPFLFVGIPVAMIFSSMFLGRLLAALVGGGVMGAAVYVVFGDWVPASVFGFFFFIFILMGASRGRGGNWSSGSGGFSSGGFSSGGGGGFSGGGGGFSGGGSSGSW